MFKIKNAPPIVFGIIGLLFYALTGVLSLYIASFNYFKMLAVLVFLWAFVKSPKNISIDSSRPLLIVFVVYTLFILLRGTIIGRFPVDNGHELGSIYEIIKYLFVYRHSALVYILVFVVLIPFDKAEIRYYRVLCFACTFICIIAILIFRNELFVFDSSGETDIPVGDSYLSIRLLISMCFIGLEFVLLYAYSQKSFKSSWVSYLSIFVILLYALAQIAGGGRGGAITAFLYVVFLIYFFLRGGSTSNLFIIIFRLAFVIAILYGIYYVLFESNFTDYLYRRLFVGGEIGGELNESTRERYMSFLIDDLNSHPLAWFFGKGCNGAYSVGSSLRSTIEWGYMYLILKGGIVYLVLYVCVLLKSFFLGFFKSKNQLCKAMAVLCLLRVYSLIPFGIPDVSVEFLLIWRFVRFLNTNEVRAMSDAQINQLL